MARPSGALSYVELSYSCSHRLHLLCKHEGWQWQQVRHVVVWWRVEGRFVAREYRQVRAMGSVPEACHQCCI